MLPDSHGYLWIGTLDGLLRYNGTDVKNYNRSVLHTESSSISCIFEDSDNNIWIGTEGGLSVYVRENDEFVKVTLRNPPTLGSMQRSDASSRTMMASSGFP